MSDPDHVRDQYATEDRLETRRSVWRPTADGQDPETEALRAIDRALVGDAHVLEVGCGTGAMAERIDDLPGVTLVATDFSPRFVELTAARGVDARQADICYLPFDDALLRRRLRRLDALPRARPRAGPQRGPPGAAARRHVRRGDQRPTTTSPTCGARPAAGPGHRLQQRDRRVGAARRFDDVRRHDLATRAVPRPRQRPAYLDSVDEGLVLPPFEGEREYAGAVTVFEAR